MISNVISDEAYEISRVSDPSVRSACGQLGLGRTNFGQVGPISDAKNGPGGLNLVD